MNLFRHFQHRIRDAILSLAEQGTLALPDQPEDLLSAITAEPPRDADHGDIATNAAMVLAKPCRMKPRDIAELLKPVIEAFDDVIMVEIAGPGFINLRLAPSIWQQQVATILTEGINYGDSQRGEGRKVNVEYVSANPTGPMHIGHARGAVVGDALARLLSKAGYAVTKEYYVNDAGAQVEVLARSAHMRYREALGEDIGEIPEGLYPGDYLKPVGAALVQHHGDKYKDAPESEWLALFKQEAMEAMMALIQSDLMQLGVSHDVFTSEQSLVNKGKVEEALSALEDKGLIYTGVLEPPKGKTPDDWEPRPQTLFKSSAFGDDVDRALKKSDGSYTYLTPDIAYHYDKFQRGHAIMIDVLGADHGGYVKRIKASVSAMSDKQAELHVLLCQLVRLLKNNEPFKMSKRAGNFVLLSDVVELVGKDVLRFIMLTRKSDAQLDFDVDKVREQSKDNPVFYVQYAHARCKSVLRHAKADMPESYAQSAKPDMTLLALLEHPTEQHAIRKLANWPRIVETAAETYEPHRIAFCVQEMAAEFHMLWNKGNDDETMRFLLPDQPDRTAARLALVRAVATVIASGLNVMGVEPLEEMH